MVVSVYFFSSRSNFNANNFFNKKHSTLTSNFALWDLQNAGLRKHNVTHTDAQFSDTAIKYTSVIICFLLWKGTPVKELQCSFKSHLQEESIGINS